MISKNKTLVVIMGATATGKSNLAIALAQRYLTEIISCDSRQFYREIPIGTAAPTIEQQGGVRHHFVGSRWLEQEYSAGLFALDAAKLLEELFERHDVVVMVGGSGLYINALVEGMDQMPEIDQDLRAELISSLQEEGLPSLVERLNELDPQYCMVVDRSNPQRVIRALEVCLQTGETFSSLRKGERAELPYRVVKIGATMPRDILYERINKRVDIMIDSGLESEARGVYHLRHLNSLQTVGYREFFAFFDGETSKDEAVELIKRNSRRYAKRQQTWFKRDPSTLWVNPREKSIDEIGKLVDDLVVK